MKALRFLRFLWCFVPLFRGFGVPVQVHRVWEYAAGWFHSLPVGCGGLTGCRGCGG